MKKPPKISSTYHFTLRTRSSAFHFREKCSVSSFCVVVVIVVVSHLCWHFILYISFVKRPFVFISHLFTFFFLCHSMLCFSCSLFFFFFDFVSVFLSCCLLCIFLDIHFHLGVGNDVRAKVELFQSSLLFSVTLVCVPLSCSLIYSISFSSKHRKKRENIILMFSRESASSINMLANRQRRNQTKRNGKGQKHLHQFKNRKKWHIHCLTLPHISNSFPNHCFAFDLGKMKRVWCSRARKRVWFCIFHLSILYLFGRKKERKKERNTVFQGEERSVCWFRAAVVIVFNL